MTHSLAILEISDQAYDEMKALFVKAGYDHIFMSDGTINMNGIGVKKKVPPVVVANLNETLEKHSGPPHWM